MKGWALHRKIHEVLRTRILQGRFGSSGKLPTEAQLMEEFKVSRITVMRAMRDLQQEGLIWRRQGAGSFVRDSEDDQLRLGIITPELLHAAGTDSLLPTIQDHLAREATKLGLRVFLGNLEMSQQSDPSTWATVEVAQRLLAHGAKAAVFCPLPFDSRWNAVNLNVLAEFKSARMPVVLLGRDIVQYPERSKWDLVSMDDMNAGYQIGKHLVALRCRQILFVCGRGQSPQLRLMGLRQALAENMGTLAEELVWDQASLERVKMMIQQKKCDGIVCENDLAAARVMADLIAAGVRIDDCVRMGSFENVAIDSPLPTPLTSFAQPIEGMARAAISTLIERKRDPSLPPCFIQLEGRLVLRKPARK